MVLTITMLVTMLNPSLRYQSQHEVEDLLRSHYGEETHVAVHVEPK